MDKNFQKLLIEELELFFTPITNYINNEEDLIVFFESFGWDIKQVLGSSLEINHFLTALEEVPKGIEEIKSLIENPPESISDFSSTLSKVLRIVEAVDKVVNLVEVLQQNNTNNLTNVDFNELTKIPVDLINSITIKYLFYQHNFVYRVFRVLGLIEAENQSMLVSNDDFILRSGRPIVKIRFDKISNLFTNPKRHFDEIYGFNDLSNETLTADSGSEFFERCALLLLHFNIIPKLGQSDVIGDPLIDDYQKERGSAIFSKIFQNYDVNTQTSSVFQFGALFRLLSDLEPNGSGLRIEPFGDIDIETIIGEWKLALEASASPGAIDITKNGIEVTLPDGGGSLTDFKIGLDLTKLGDPDLGNQALLIGSTTGTRFEIKEISFGGFFEIPDVSDIESLHYGGRLKLGEAAFVIQGGDGDGFIAKILPEEGLRLAFDMGLEWTNKKGFKFTYGISSGNALELSIPLNQTLFNVIDFKDVRFRLAGEPGNKGVATSIGGSIGLSIGPFNAMVENMGMKAVFNLPESGGGNLGPLDLDFGFKPPSGIGMSIDAGGFKGGGFLSLEEPRYVGALQLTFASGFNISAVCIITTKLPGVEEGFSLLVVITVEFSPGIQVGMGLSITGFGGILALHRSIDADVVRAGLKTGMLESILFPQDILNNPEKVISDLDAAFPIQKDHFVFGPMLKGAWGDKSLVSISVGLMIELPDPRIMLPGLIGISLLDTGGDDGDETFKVLDINIAFVGILDIPGKMISIDASIYNSKILTMVIEGDMAFRLTWGDNPVFVLSMGGFHPSFTPPPLGLSDMKRLSIIILNEDFVKLYVESYLAITSNTFQFGAKAVFFVDLKIIAIDVLFSLDTIFFFNPFNMEVGVVLKGAILFGGKPLLSLSAAATLTGPSPWHIYGSVSVNIGGFLEFEGSFDEQFGKAIPETTPTIELKSLLLESLLNTENWKPVNGVAQHELVTFAKGPEDVLLIRPMGSLEISQNIMPLAFDMEKFGTNEIEGSNRFDIEKVKVNGNEVSLEEVEEFFAPMEFQKIEDKTAAVEAESFEKYTSGVRISSSSLRAGRKRTKAVAHELALVDVAVENPIVPPTTTTTTTTTSPTTVSTTTTSHLSARSSVKESAPLAHSTARASSKGIPYESETALAIELKRTAVARSEFSKHSPIVAAKAKQGIKIHQQKYRLVDARSLQPIDSGAYNYRAAKMKLKETIEHFPLLENEVKIVPIEKRKVVTNATSASSLSDHIKTINHPLAFA